MTNFIEYLEAQIAFSEKTFGPPRGSKGVIDHIKKELKEIEENPEDLEEWVDLMILSFDGAWREGYSPEEMMLGLWKKLKINSEQRVWPDWRTCVPGKAIEHIQGEKND